MTPKEYFKFAREFAEEMISLSEQKNADYSGDIKNTFGNFEAVEKLGICSVEVGFLTRMTDKMKRIVGYVNSGSLQVKDESIKDTLQDLCNYTLLLAGYLESKKKITKTDTVTTGGISMKQI